MIHRKERISEQLSFRVTKAQRAFLEKMSQEKNVGLCEAARMCLDDVMSRGMLA